MPNKINIFKLFFAVNLSLWPVFCISCVLGSNIFAHNFLFWLLGSIFIVCNCLLFYGKSLNNVFLPIIGLNTLVFFIFGLCYLPLREDPGSFYSAERITRFQPESYFKAMLIVILSNLLCLILNFRRKKTAQSFACSTHKIKSACFLILILLSFTIYQIYSLPTSNQYITILRFVYSTIPIPLFYFIYILFPKNKINKLLKILCFSLLLTSLFFGLLQGRRSDVFVACISYLTVLFATGTITIKRNIVISLSAISILSVLSFSFITELRTAKRESEGSYWGGSILQNEKNKFSKKRVAHIIEPVFERLSSLDLVADCIKNKFSYREIVNLKYYVKSVADNLVPGIWFYDVPRASNALRTIYSDFLLKRQMDSYHSDMFTAYGELFIFTNFIITPIIFYCIFFIFSLIYYNLDRFRLCNPILKLFMLSLFVSNLNSYGNDWTIISCAQASFWIVLATLFVC